MGWVIVDLSSPNTGSRYIDNNGNVRIDAIKVSPGDTLYFVDLQRWRHLGVHTYALQADTERGDIPHQIPVEPRFDPPNIPLDSDLWKLTNFGDFGFHYPPINEIRTGYIEPFRDKAVDPIILDFNGINVRFDSKIYCTSSNLECSIIDKKGFKKAEARGLEERAKAPFGYFVDRARAYLFFGDTPSNIPAIEPRQITGDIEVPGRQHVSYSRGEYGTVEYVTQKSFEKTELDARKLTLSSNTPPGYYGITISKSRFSVSPDFDNVSTVFIRVVQGAGTTVPTTRPPLTSDRFRTNYNDTEVALGRHARFIAPHGDPHSTFSHKLSDTPSVIGRPSFTEISTYLVGNPVPGIIVRTNGSLFASNTTKPGTYDIIIRTELRSSRDDKFLQSYNQRIQVTVVADPMFVEEEHFTLKRGQSRQLKAPRTSPILDHAPKYTLLTQRKDISLTSDGLLFVGRNASLGRATLRVRVENPQHISAINTVVVNVELEAGDRLEVNAIDNICLPQNNGALQEFSITNVFNNVHNLVSFDSVKLRRFVAGKWVEAALDSTLGPETLGWYSFNNNTLTIRIGYSFTIASILFRYRGVETDGGKSFNIHRRDREDQCSLSYRKPLPFPSDKPLSVEQPDIALNGNPPGDVQDKAVLNSASEATPPYRYSLMKLATLEGVEDANTGDFDETSRILTAPKERAAKPGETDAIYRMRYNVRDSVGVEAHTDFLLSIIYPDSNPPEFEQSEWEINTSNYAPNSVFALPQVVDGTGYGNITYSVDTNSLPIGFLFSSDTLTLSQSPLVPDSGFHFITYTATDENGDSVTLEIKINVTDVLGQPPELPDSETLVIDSSTASLNLQRTGAEGFSYELEFEQERNIADRATQDFTIESGDEDTGVDSPSDFMITSISRSRMLAPAGQDKAVSAVYIKRLNRPHWVPYPVSATQLPDGQNEYTPETVFNIRKGSYEYFLQFEDGTYSDGGSAITGTTWTSNLPPGIRFHPATSEIIADPSTAAGTYQMRYTATHPAASYQKEFSLVIENAGDPTIPISFRGIVLTAAKNSGEVSVAMPEVSGGALRTCALANKGYPVLIETEDGDRTVHYDVWYGFEQSFITDPGGAPAGFSLEQDLGEDEDPLNQNPPVLKVDTEDDNLTAGRYTFTLVATWCDGVQVTRDFIVEASSVLLLPTPDDITQDSTASAQHTLERAVGGTGPYTHRLCGVLQNSYDITWVDQEGANDWNQLWTNDAGGTLDSVGIVVNAGTTDSPRTPQIVGVGVRASTGDFEAYINPGSSLNPPVLTGVELACGRRTVTRNGGLTFPGSGGKAVHRYTINDVPSDALVSQWDNVIFHLQGASLPISRTSPCVPVAGTSFNAARGEWSVSNRVVPGLYHMQYSVTDSATPTPTIKVSRFNFRMCKTTPVTEDLVLPNIEDISVGSNEELVLPLTEAVGGTGPYTYSIVAAFGSHFDVSTDNTQPLTLTKKGPLTPAVYGVLYSVTDSLGAIAFVIFFIRVEDLPEIVGESDISHFCAISYPFPEKFDVGGTATNRMADLVHLGDALYMVVAPVGLDNDPALYSINPDTGVRTLVGNISGISGFGDEAYVAGLSVNSRRNELVLAVTENFPARTVLYGINQATAEVTFTSTALDREVTQMHNTPLLLSTVRRTLGPASLEVKGFTPVTGNQELAPDTVADGTLGFVSSSELPGYFEDAATDSGPVFKDFTSNEEFLKGGALYYINPNTGTMYHYLDSAIASQHLVSIGEVDGWYEDTETDYYGPVLGASILDGSSLYTLHRDTNDASKLILTRRDRVTPTDWSRVPIKTGEYIKISSNTEEGPGTSAKVKAALVKGADDILYAINTPTVTVNDAVMYKVGGTSGKLELVGPLGLTGFPTNSFIVGAGYNTVTEKIEVLTGVWGGSARFTRLYSVGTETGLATLIHQFPDTADFRGLRGFTCVHDRRFVARDNTTAIMELDLGLDAVRTVPYIDSTELDDFKPAALVEEGCSLVTLDRRKGSIYRDETNEFERVVFPVDGGTYHAGGIRSHLYTFLEDNNKPGKAELIFYPQDGWIPLSLFSAENLVHEQGSFFTETLPAASGGVTPYRYVLTTSDGSELPEGIFFDPDTREMSVSESLTEGVYNLQYIATDLDGSFRDSDFTLTVITLATLDDEQHRVPNASESTIVLGTASGGTGPFIYSLTPNAETLNNIKWEFDSSTRQMIIPENQDAGTYTFSYSAFDAGARRTVSSTLTLTVDLLMSAAVKPITVSVDTDPVTGEETTTVVDAIMPEPPITCPEGFYLDIHGRCVEQVGADIPLPPVDLPPEDSDVKVETRECRYEVTLTPSQLVHIKDKLSFRVPEKIYAKELRVLIYATVGAEDTELYDISSTDGLFDIKKEKDHFTVTFTTKLAYELAYHTHRHREERPDYLFVFCTSFPAGKLESLFNPNNISAEAIRNEFLRLDLQDLSEKPLNFEVNSSHLAPGAVKSEDIESDQIGDEHFRNRTIEMKELAEDIPSDKLGTDSIKAVNIPDCSLTGGKFGERVLQRKFGPFKPLREGAIHTEHFVDEAVTSKDILEVDTRNFGKDIFDAETFSAADVFKAEHFSKDRSITSTKLTFDFINAVPQENSITGDMIQDGSLGARHLFYDDFRHLIKDPDYLTRLEVKASFGAKRFDLVSVIRATDIGSEDLIAVPWNGTESRTYPITKEIHVRYDLQRFPFTEGVVGVASLVPSPDDAKRFGVGETDPYDLAVHQDGDNITMYMVGSNKVLYRSDCPDGYFMPLIKGAVPGYGINPGFEMLKIAVRVPLQGKVELWGLGRDEAADTYGIYKIETSDNRALGVAELVYKIGDASTTDIPQKVQFVDNSVMVFDYPNPQGRYDVLLRTYQEYRKPGSLSKTTNRPEDKILEGQHVFVDYDMPYSPTRYTPSAYSLYYNRIIDINEFEPVSTPDTATGALRTIRPLESIREVAREALTEDDPQALQDSPLGMLLPTDMITISGTRSIFGLGKDQVYYLGETLAFTREVR